MEKKLAVIVDNKEEITTEVVNTELCSSACDVAVETCSSENTDTCGDGSFATTEILHIKHLNHPHINVIITIRITNF